MASLTNFWINVRTRLTAWQQQRLFDHWRNEWRARRGY
jgi:hypothetical protein